MANDEILINTTSYETRVAVLECGRVKELHLERADKISRVGNIYIGKVQRIVPGMQAAFIDIGIDKNAFLAAAELVKSAAGMAKQEINNKLKRKKIELIENLLHNGETICVQVLKDPTGDKGARLGTELSLPSRNLVYLPNSNKIAISKNIDSGDERTRLVNLVQDCFEQSSLSGGLIVRTQAEFASDEEIKSDIDYLERLWTLITKAIKKASPASIVHSEIPLALRVMRDFASVNLDKIVYDNKQMFIKARAFATETMPDKVTIIECHTGDQPLFDLYNVELEIKNALQRKVMLNSGGNLLIDATSAMITIDVNTGAYVGHNNIESTLLNTNLEAAEEIAHQLRLRNCGGITVIDFIDMANKYEVNQVLNVLKSSLSKDKVKTSVTDFSPLSLVEITRKRTRESLAEMMCEPCPICHGVGIVKTPQTVCFYILRELMQLHQKFKAPGYTILTSPEVVEVMRNTLPDELTKLEDITQCRIDMRADHQFQQHDYELVLDAV